MFELSYSNDEEFRRFLIYKVQQRLSGTSVMPVDEIQEIRASILFVMDHAEKGNSVVERFNSGKELLTAKLQDTFVLYQQLTSDYKSFEIESIKDTLDEIGGFFKSYNLDYSATVSGAGLIDYQLANPVNDLQYQGIDFIQQYLTRLSSENKFIDFIPSNQIREILQVYTQRLGFDYRKDINNLYQLIFDQWIAQKIAGSSTLSLLLTEPEAQFVYSIIQQRSIPAELTQFLVEHPYHQQTFQRFVQRVLSLDEPASIKNVLLLEESLQYELTLISAMPANDFTRMLETVETLKKQQDQVHFLLEKITSPYDLLDFLEQEVVSRECCLQLLKEVSFELGLGLLLLVNQYQEGMLKSWDDVLLLDEDEELTIEGVKSFVQRLEPQQRVEVTRALQQFTIGERDFS
ncbi:hypothetical protein JZO67_005167 [Enterococcus sp. 665A]|uniref:Uncharacterized protein n=1 Tax=Candidatus Enterococcus ferrettii TaxID=2815324 RepID=A0ABV0EX72_9ENTE